MIFRIALWLARRGWFQTREIIVGMTPWPWPQARVAFGDGEFTVAMAIGDAVRWAQKYGGAVVPPRFGRSCGEDL